MMFKKKTGSASKTFLASLVIFNLIFTSAAMPVVSLAFEGEAAESRDNTESASQTSSDEGEKSEKGDTGKDEKGEPKEDGPKTEDPKKDTPSKDEGGSKGGGGGGSSSFNPNRKKGQVKGEETASCDVGNLIVNGSFENPSVDHASDWNIYPDGTSSLVWDVAWNGSFVGAPTVANMEIHSGVNGWSAYVGSQYAELDADWGGPADPMYGEQASTKISQTIETVPGNKYMLHFAFAARPGTSAADNKLGIYIDDGIFDLSSVSSFGEYYSDQPYWIVRDFEFTAYNTETKISFLDIGTPNSVGTFLDDVRVNCIEDGGEACPANNMIYARLKLTPQPYGWRNWGNGNTSGKIFVGGSDADDVYLSNEWFPLTNADGTFINDADISGYRDVPGLALERKEGAIRVVLYGFLYDDVKPKDGSVIALSSKVEADRSGGSTASPNYYMLNRELSQASIEFSTDMVNRSTTVVPTSQVSDPANPMDYVAGVHQYHPGSDNFRMRYNLSQFHLLVTSGSDGFYTYYEDQGSNGGKDCPPDEKTGSLTVNKVVQGQGNGTFHFNGPNGTFDITTNGGTGNTTIDGLVAGTYTVTEAPMAGWDIVSTTCTNVVVTADATTDCTIVNTMDDGGTGCVGNECPGEGACESGAIWARVNVDNFYNLGTGDLTSNIYLGSDSNVIASGQWFMVYDGTNYINDADISAYEDVAGLAVQRMNGKVRVLLHGSSTPTPNHKEYVDGNVEFFNGLVTAVSSDNSGNNKLENGVNGALDLVTFAGDRAYFEIQVDVADDAFFANYTYSLDENCDDGEDEDPGIEIGDSCVLFGTDFPMDRITITNNDGTYDHSNIFIFDLNTFHADIPGNYPLSITLKDDEGNIVAGPVNAVFTVAAEGAKDCDNGGDGQNPVITVTGQSCVNLDATTFNFAAGASATDAEDGILPVTIVSSAVVFGTAGTYNVSYSATDSDLNTTTVNRLFTISPNCETGGENTPPVITYPIPGCIETSVTTFNFAIGVNATDAEDGNITSSLEITNEENVLFGTIGNYPVTYSVTDEDGSTTTVTLTFPIREDCGGDEDNVPVITVTGQSCVNTSATSYDFAAGASATDAENGTRPVAINSTAVVFGTAGTYNVIYSASDLDGNGVESIVPFTISEDCGGTGGGDDADPAINAPAACILNSVTSFDFLDGVTATDDEDGNLALTLEANVTGEELVTFGTNGDYTVTYSVTDSIAQTTTVSRTITISDDCDDNGGGGGGGGSSSGSRSRRNRGEVLGAESCVAFTQYNDTGSTKSEVKALQTFLNEYMDAGLTVNGTYDRATTQAVHDFQAMHWDDIIDPWTPPLSPNTTGREYKTTRATINAIIECPEAPVYLEDPQTMFSIIEVKNQKAFTESQIDKVTELLIEAQSGAVSGVSEGK